MLYKRYNFFYTLHIDLHGMFRCETNQLLHSSCVSAWCETVDKFPQSCAEMFLFWKVTLGILDAPESKRWRTKFESVPLKWRRSVSELFLQLLAELQPTVCSTHPPATSSSPPNIRSDNCRDSSNKVLETGGPYWRGSFTQSLQILCVCWRHTR